MGAALQALGIAVGGFALAAQFWLTVSNAGANGTSVPAAVVAYFSFFTILTNIFVLLVHLAGLTGALPFFRRPRVVAVAAVSIAVVCIVYHLVLAQIWNPQGLQYVADKLLHYAAPALMVVWWLGWGRTGGLRFADLPVFLIYPVVYLVYVLVRAPIAQSVPYPFLDYWTLGWTSVIQSMIGVTILFVAVASIAVLADRFLPARPTNRIPA